MMKKIWVPLGVMFNHCAAHHQLMTHSVHRFPRVSDDSIGEMKDSCSFRAGLRYKCLIHPDNPHSRRFRASPCSLPPPDPNPFLLLPLLIYARAAILNMAAGGGRRVSPLQSNRRIRLSTAPLSSEGLSWRSPLSCCTCPVGGRPSRARMFPRHTLPSC